MLFYRKNFLIKHIPFLICGALSLMSFPAEAVCLLGDSVRASQGLEEAITIYEECALNFNDDDAHLLLARVYQKGDKNIPANSQRALLFYHLSSENGNAQAQYEFAKWLLELDETPEGRAEIQRYLGKVKAAFVKDTGSFKGELIHPYALLMLAAENPSQKWYYPTTVLSAPDASYFLKNYQIDEGKKQAALKQASTFKNTKLFEMAQSVLTASEYQAFSNAVNPQQGRADPFRRAQALEDLKEKIAARRQSITDR